MTTILLTNDDGVRATGLALLRRALEGLGDVLTVAPESDASGVARGITIHRPLRVTSTPFGEGPDKGAFVGYGLDGTPVDCVRVGLLGALAPRPDLIVSGINYGANMGNDLTYSGTVGATLEGALHGVAGIAFSVESLTPSSLETMVPLVRGIVEHMLAVPMPFGTVLNVNLPDRPRDQIRGLRVTSLGGTSRHDRVLLQTNGAEPQEHWLNYDREAMEPWVTTDFEAVAEGYVSLTPIHYELTSRSGLAALAERPLHELIGDEAGERE
jgi:5'-nucleotidase